MQRTIANLANLRSLDLRDNCFIDEHRLKSKILGSAPGLEQYNNESVKAAGNELESTRRCLD